jgi:hypothetical protein
MPYPERVSGILYRYSCVEDDMKRFWLCAVLLAFTTTANAADPFVGTYRLNVAQSKSSDAQPFPLAATLTISEDGDNLVLAISLQNSNGSTLEKTSVPKGGGLLRRVDGGDPRYDTVTVTRPTPTTIDFVRMKDGKEGVRSRYTLGADGRVLTHSLKGTHPQGQQVDRVMVLERQ